MLDLMIRKRLLITFSSNCNLPFTGIFKTSLPAFRALRDFEWIGYPEMRAEVVQTVLTTHKHLHGLGLMCVSFLNHFVLLFI